VREVLTGSTGETRLLALSAHRGQARVARSPTIWAVCYAAINSGRNRVRSEKLNSSTSDGFNTDRS
jgi:hypothetical protein